MADSHEPDIYGLSIRQILILHNLLTTRSVSRTAIAMNLHQAGVSAVLARLREQLQDPILVRSGSQMVVTERAESWSGPCQRILGELNHLGRDSLTEKFRPEADRGVFRVAASDFLDPMFQPRLVSLLRKEAPGARIEILPLSAEYNYAEALERGTVDVVVGNWMSPPPELHIQTLFEDEIVCMVASSNPLGKRAWTVEKYLAAEHIAPTPLRSSARGVIDEYLALQGMNRRITTQVAHFSLIPSIVAHSLLVLTTGRRFCSRFVGQLPVRITTCPVAFPPLRYYQLWHERSHRSPRNQWLRRVVKQVAG